MLSEAILWTDKGKEADPTVVRKFRSYLYPATGPKTTSFDLPDPPPLVPDFPDPPRPRDNESCVHIHLETFPLTTGSGQEM